MKIAFFGGSFNPPHLGHLNSAVSASDQLKPDLFMIIPDHKPPHKTLEQGSPGPEQRLELCKLNFSAVSNVEISDIEVNRGGKSYTADTVCELLKRYPGAQLVMLVGTDMLLDLGRWYQAEYILKNVAVATFQRAPEEEAYLKAKAEELRSRFGAKVEIIQTTPFEAASTTIRAQLRDRGGNDFLTDEVYSYIIRHRLYNAKVNLPWLRSKAYAMLKPKRIPHVEGCENEAVALTKRWGGDPEISAEAAILHDCTKKSLLDEQLLLCERYGIVPDALELKSEKLLHAKTGAALAESVFGVTEDVASAIRWHTTGRPGMTLLEKIIYLADYIEPTRCFDGVDELRRLAYIDLDRAMLLGLEMSIEDIQRQGNPVHCNTTAARDWFSDRVKEKEKEEESI